MRSVAAQLASALVVASISLPLCGSRPGRTLQSPETHLSPAASAAIEQSKRLVQNRQLDSATHSLEQRLGAASTPFDRACLLLALGNVHVAGSRYREALKAYSEGQQLAQEQGFTKLLSLLSWSRMNIYLLMGNQAAARESIEPVLQLAPSEVPPATFIFAARCESDIDRAFEFCVRGIRGTNASLDHRAESYGWNVLGKLYLAKGDVKSAERAFTESFRIRKLFLKGEGLAGSLFYLADVQTLQGRTEAAESLLEVAWRRHDSGDESIARMALHAAAGRAALKSGDKEEALLEFRESLDLIRQARFHTLSADDLRLSAESQHEAVLRAYVRTGMELYRETGEEHYAAAAFIAAEDHRQSVYRQRLLLSTALPPEYYSNFAAYRRMLARSLREPQNTAHLRQLHEIGRRISEIENRLGLENSTVEISHQKNERTNSADLLLHLQKKLNADEAVLSFSLGRERSYLWCLTREGLSGTELPDEAAIARLVGEFSESIKVNHPKLKTGAERLFKELFKDVSERALSKPSWLIVPDGALLKLPFAALTNARDGRFLIESHTLRVLPSAMMLTDQSGPQPARAEFAGFGDAIYNSADPRYKGREQAGGELGRLPASARELKLSAKAFARDDQPALSTGLQFTRHGLQSAFASKPAVLHLAGHVLQHPKDPAQVLIATGLTNNGEQDFLAPREIMTWRGGAGLVMLSGCGSGSGSELPGLGLIGLTRSWLIAGAQTVAATYWPIEDSDSGLVTTFYSALRHQAFPMTSSSVAKSMQAAQVDALRQGGWRAEPSYWAGFFVVGKD